MLSKEFITQAGELLRENADVYGDMEKGLRAEGYTETEIKQYVEATLSMIAEVEAIFEDKRSVNQWKRDGYVFVTEEALNETKEISHDELYESLCQMAEDAHEDEEEDEEEKEEGMHEGAHEDEEEDEEEVDEATISEQERGQRTKAGRTAAGAAGAGVGAAAAKFARGAGKRGMIGVGILGLIAGKMLYKGYKKAAKEAEKSRIGVKGVLDPRVRAERMYKARIKELNAKKAVVKSATQKALSDPAHKGNVKKKERIQDYGSRRVTKIDAQIANASRVYRARKIKLGKNIGRG